MNLSRAFTQHYMTLDPEPATQNADSQQDENSGQKTNGKPQRRNKDDNDS